MILILRHDIDTDLAQAARFAELEVEVGVRSTYFVLLRTDFYNPASKQSLEKLHHIQALGHEIGLHFDEKAYPDGAPEETVTNILHEKDILASILGTPVTTVSMHRPSKTTLEADLKIPGMVNSYGKTFFHDFKYLSDSRRRWREPVEEIIKSEEYDRLHVLTHAFWYHEKDESIEITVGRFVRSANRERYGQMKENITDLPSILKEDEFSMKITEVSFFLEDQNIPFEFRGNSDLEVEGFSSLTCYKKNSFTWIKTQKIFLTALICLR